jgi:hypothetical protein
MLVLALVLVLVKCWQNVGVGVGSIGVINVVEQGLDLFEE